MKKNGIRELKIMLRLTKKKIRFLESISSNQEKIDRLKEHCKILSDFIKENE